MKTCFLPDSEATETAGALLAHLCSVRQLIFLQGNLGAGKTTLVRGFLRALGYQGAVKSPTYTLVEAYVLDASPTPVKQLYHFDLYRLGDPEELEYLGFRDYLDTDALCLVEWAEKGVGFLPAASLCVQLAYAQTGRTLCLSATADAALALQFEALLQQHYAVS